jgi:2-iminobutanoate/2-iminopropanoate deaminase
MAGKRQVIHIPGLAHQNPIPNGARIDNIVCSSAISGRDTQAGTMPEDPDTQAACMFRNLRTFMELAGGTPENIIHVAVTIKDNRYRESLNKEWLKMFPDEHSRPARHVSLGDLGSSMYFNLEVMAVL